MSKLRILEVTKSTGGVGEYMRWLAHGLDHQQFELTFACLSEDSDILAAELSQVEGVKAFSLAMDRYRISPLSDSRVAFALANHIRKERYDLIHAHASKPGFLARLAAAGTNTPVIYSPHCFSFHPGAGWLKARILAFIERLMARFFTSRFLVVADGEKALAQTYGVGQPDQFTTVYSGVDTGGLTGQSDPASQRALLGLPTDNAVVGTVGRLGEQKAPLDFVRAAHKIAQEKPNVHFLWVGSGPLLAEAKHLTATLELSDKMHFAGQRSDIPACLAAMDCFVLLSRWEGFPIVVLEAMAAGIPVVGTDIPGTNEAITHEVDGLLVPVSDPGACASAVNRLLSDPELAERFRTAAQKKIQTRFNQSQMIAQISQVYLETAQSRPHG